MSWLRAVLAPLTAWRARRLSAAYGPGLDRETAWRLVRLATHPEDVHFATHRQIAAPESGPIRWEELSSAERERRLAWIRRHGTTPLAALGLNPELLERARLNASDWDLPPSADSRLGDGA